MNLNPLEALSSFVLGVLRQGKIQAWARIIASLAMSALVTGMGTWGLAILGGASILRASAISAVSVSAILIHAWIRHPVTRQIPLFWPGRLERERQRMLIDDTIVSHTGADT